MRTFQKVIRPSTTFVQTRLTSEFIWDPMDVNWYDRILRIRRYSSTTENAIVSCVLPEVPLYPSRHVIAGYSSRRNHNTSNVVIDHTPKYTIATPAIPTICLDWSPQDDGIEIVLLHSSTGTPPIKGRSNSYISDVPLGPNFLRLAAGAAAHIVVFGQD